MVDYYREDEPIELGPDENMHDEMIEEIAALSKRRGYILGIGIMSSKRVGINHKEYGVTSTGVVTFAEITMTELGIDIRRDPFSVKFTGGPNGDVAGNAMRHPAGALAQGAASGSSSTAPPRWCDPAGADRDRAARASCSSRTSTPSTPGRSTPAASCSSAPAAGRTGCGSCTAR